MPPVASKRERAALRSSEVAERETIGPYYRRGGGIFCIFEAIGPCGLTRTAQNSALGILLFVPQIYFRSVFCCSYAHRMIRPWMGMGVFNCVARALKVIGKCLARPALPPCRDERRQGSVLGARNHASQRSAWGGAGPLDGARWRIAHFLQQRLTSGEVICIVRGSRGVAQSGSALALGARCREFESLHPDQSLTPGARGDLPVAQLDRAPAF